MRQWECCFAAVENGALVAASPALWRRWRADLDLLLRLFVWFEHSDRLMRGLLSDGNHCIVQFVLGVDAPNLKSRETKGAAVGEK